MAAVGVRGPAKGLPIETPEVISYYPTTGDALRFWSMREDKNVHLGVPKGFPKHIDGPMVWQGSDMEQQSDAWLVPLSDTDVLALEVAMHDFQSTIKAFLPFHCYRLC